jgi:hypothetical protein
MGAMKRLSFALAALIGAALASPAPAHATEVGTARRFGLGFALGSPTSIVGKYFLDQRNAIDFGVGFWRYGRNCDGGPPPGRRCDNFGYLGLAADYLWQEPLATGSAKLDWHIGAGGRLWVGDDQYYNDNNVALAARMPVGLDLTFDRPNFLEVFLELAPVLFIVPGVDFDIEAFVGVRFYF